MLEKESISKRKGGTLFCILSRGQKAADLAERSCFFLEFQSRIILLLACYVSTSCWTAVKEEASS